MAPKDAAPAQQVEQGEGGPYAGVAGGEVFVPVAADSCLCHIDPCRHPVPQLLPAQHWAVASEAAVSSSN